jgi:hypothetical protein
MWVKTITLLSIIVTVATRTDATSSSVYSGFISNIAPGSATCGGLTEVPPVLIGNQPSICQASYWPSPGAEAFGGALTNVYLTVDCQPTQVTLRLYSDAVCTNSLRGFARNGTLVTSWWPNPMTITSSSACQTPMNVGSVDSYVFVCQVSAASGSAPTMVVMLVGLVVVWISSTLVAAPM